MDKDFALRIAAKIGIDVQQVVREEAELIFLRGIFDSSFADKLIFKGGTALRLVYQSFRFSEDLDFSVTGKVSSPDFEKTITKIVRQDARFSIKDLATKYYTHLAQIRIKEPWFEVAFSMKIEISKRVTQETEEDFANMLAKSPVTNFSLSTKVYTLERIFEDKVKMIRERKMPRDIFDLWFICQKTNRPFEFKDFGYPKGKIRQELRKFLPKGLYPVVEELEKYNAQRL